MIYSQFLENATDADSGISVEPCVMTATVTLDTGKKLTAVFQSLYRVILINLGSLFPNPEHGLRKTRTD